MTPSETESLIASVHRLIYRIAWRIARRYSGTLLDVEDLAQEAFLRLLQVIGQHRPEVPFPAWAAVVCHRAMTQAAVRLQAGLPFSTLTRPDSGPLFDPKDHRHTVDADASPDVAVLLARLQPAEREMVLSAMAGATYEEIGREDGVTRQRVGQRMNRAIGKMRRGASPTPP